jgi:hypothetical protein
MRIWCGNDWAERHHDVALVDEEGKPLLALLAAHGAGPAQPVGPPFYRGPALSLITPAPSACRRANSYRYWETLIAQQGAWSWLIKRVSCAAILAAAYARELPHPGGGGGDRPPPCRWVATVKHHRPRPDRTPSTG